MFGVVRLRAFRDIFNRNNISQYGIFYNITEIFTPLAAGLNTDTESAVSDGNKSKSEKINLEARHVYPEFLPDPNMKFRNTIREKLERSDMLKRRSNIELPEFYVGSILAVTSSNVHAPMKTTRFVGICVQRQGCGLRANFTLRNMVDNQGVQIIYDLYDPTIQKIEVLRLEKRLDKDLLYLNDAEPEYTTFPFDMEAEYLAEGEPIPVNPIKVKLKPIPWKARYEIKGYVGIQEYDIPEIRWKLAERVKKHNPPEEVERNDLMKVYRATIPEEEQERIYSEVLSEIQKYEIKRRKVKRRSDFVAPKKTA